MRKKRIIVISGVLMAGAFAAMSAGALADKMLQQVEVISPANEIFEDVVAGVGFIGENGGAWTANVSVGESDIRKVKVGQKAKIKGAAFDSGIYTATVSTVSDTARQEGGQTVVDVALTLDNPDEQLRSGYSAQADIITEEARTLCTVPYNVVLQDNGGEFVYVLDESVVRRRDIITGVELDNCTEVVKGISGSDKIITDPAAVIENSLVRGSVQ